MKPKEIVDLVFGNGGLLAKQSPGYEARAPQVKLSEEIAKRIQDGGVLIAEAPTGTGKSLAYLVPATFAAAKVNAYREGPARRVVVATANIALQEQLIAKDLPQLAKVLPWSFSFEVAKGISNYVCKERLLDATGSTADPLFGADAKMLTAIESWERETPTGDLEELEEAPSPRVRSLVTISHGECPGKKCPSANECHARNARARYREADVIVANYHLLIADAESGNAVLPPFDILIADEANKLPDIARDIAGSRVSLFSVMRIARMVQHEAADEVQRVEVAANAFFGMASRFLDEVESRIGYDGALNGDPLVEALEELRPALLRAAKSEDIKRAKMAGDAVDRLSEIQAFIRKVKTPKGSDQVFFIERSERGYVTIASKLVDPSDYLRTNFFERIDTVIATSATLCTSPGDFEFIIGELGAEKSDEMTVESPYDHARNMLLVVPDLPEPTSQAYGPKMAEALAACVAQANGRTLGLFTSWRTLKQAAEHLRRVWRGRVLVQGEMPRAKLIREFRDDVSSVLLGTESFWSGLDIQGESCSVVVIDRLPFPNVKDPLQQVLAERAQATRSNAFQTQQMPRALTQLRQGVGRLIRSRSDFGAVVILDSRIITKGYGKTFMNAIGGKRSRMTRDISEIGAFLDARKGGR